MISYPPVSGADAVFVDASAMQQLTERYAEYRDIISRDLFDPVGALTVTGEVLASVREVVTNVHTAIAIPENSTDQAFWQ